MTVTRERFVDEPSVAAISHYSAKQGVAALTLTDGPLATGDTIHTKNTRLIERSPGGS